MNEVRLSGKVTKAYVKDDGTFIMRLACKYDHKIGAETIRCESSFPVVMSDTAKTKHLDVIAPATRLILSLLISPDGVIIPLSSRVFFIGSSFSSMVPVVPSFFHKIVPCKVPGLTHDL